MSVFVKNQNGQFVEVGSAAVALGVNTARIGRQLEISGVILSRTSEDVGGTALGFSAEGPGVGHILINDNYNPDQPTKNNKRVLTFFAGNVGIGTDFSATAPPAERLVVQGNIVAGNVFVQNANQQTTITLDGELGDIILANGDCAEEFDCVDDVAPEPGSVIVLDGKQQVKRCDRAYDRRVAGVISGAGGYRPAIILDRRDLPNRVPVAIVGKVCCKVDSQYGEIKAGDLLTTSPTIGHAMRAEDPALAFGALIGKALEPLSHGTGLLPILVGLR